MGAARSAIDGFPVRSDGQLAERGVRYNQRRWRESRRCPEARQWQGDAGLIGGRMKSRAQYSLPLGRPVTSTRTVEFTNFEKSKVRMHELRQGHFLCEVPAAPNPSARRFESSTRSPEIFGRRVNAETTADDTALYRPRLGGVEEGASHRPI